ncbi:hypothetical protein MESS4_330057 [Mesorhizobium sp. STM 4661]|nr:hypothetical protein MESS4_330057 [Mesorhizobium sp. STM 4661]
MREDRFRPIRATLAFDRTKGRATDLRSEHDVKPRPFQLAALTPATSGARRQDKDQGRSSRIGLQVRADSQRIFR